MKLSKPMLTLGIAALLVTACEKKAVVIADRHLDRAPRSDTNDPEVARKQAAYAVKIGGEKFEVAAKRDKPGVTARADAGTDGIRR